MVYKSCTAHEAFITTALLLPLLARVLSLALLEQGRQARHCQHANHKTGLDSVAQHIHYPSNHARER